MTHKLTHAEIARKIFLEPHLERQELYKEGGARKCERCWRYCPCVNYDHDIMGMIDDLCARCRRVLGQIKEDGRCCKSSLDI